MVITMSINIGIDIGSTTVKMVVVEDHQIKFQKYERHMSQVRQAAGKMFREAGKVIGDRPFKVALSGSAGLGVAQDTGIDFIQEVFATKTMVQKMVPDTDAVIELGGEDAKIIFLTGGFEERMNGSCAGGTGAFIDQMASLLSVDVQQLDEISKHHTRIYPIASRCGVFAKTDIQPLLNQGAKKEDIAASIFQAVADQTVAGLAQGRMIEGKVLFLGGPLYFFDGLKERFKETLHLSDENAVFPEYGLYAVAMGTAIYAEGLSHEHYLSDIYAAFDKPIAHSDVRMDSALFASEKEYRAFQKRHDKDNVGMGDLSAYRGKVYLGVDCGSTTTKLLLLSENDEILYEYYSANEGNPVEIVRQKLMDIYEKMPNEVTIAGAVVTGYGEDLIKNAFSFDGGVVETMAHFHAARHFNPKVDFILDIGGQDIKCFRIKHNAIDSIMLNEACSSGCGSFIETFAHSMGYETKEFAKLAVRSKAPVDLGSRCTVFMNSSVKQAQKDGAPVEDISAGLSRSVVKNVLYKVIRIKRSDELGENVVVQGGTFLNDAVLRSFELETGKEVVRPNIAGLMGAFGAALYAKKMGKEQSSVCDYESLKTFTHKAQPIVCKGCTNHCNLTVNTFDGGRKFISGNRCEKPLGVAHSVKLPDLYDFKRQRIEKLRQEKNREAFRGNIGLAMGLNMYENVFFWHTFFTQLGFNVILSDESSRKLYRSGQQTIPSDTACYPAKLMHGHIQNLLDKGVRTIFYSCMTYNFDEGVGDNHFNCPVVAYYPELLKANMSALEDAVFLYPYFDVSRPKDFEKKIYEYLKGYYKDLTRVEVKKAVKMAYDEHARRKEEVVKKGKLAIEFARKNGRKMIVLSGRPYHIDPEINHGINTLITGLGLCVLSEDAVASLVDKPQKVNVLNQWTYHQRLYNAARFVTQQPDMELVQLVSFGCGIDAITTDEVNDILTRGGKLYTQLKIDEINNLGAIKIRLRSLLGAVEERESERQ